MAWRHRVCMVENQGWLRARAGVLGEMWVSHDLTVSQATIWTFSHGQQEASEGISKGGHVGASLLQDCVHENRRVGPWSFSEVEINVRGIPERPLMSSMLGHMTPVSSFLEETSSQDHRPPSSTQKPAPSVSNLSGDPRPGFLLILGL